MKRIIASMSKKITNDTSVSEDLTILKDALIHIQWIISDMEDKWMDEDTGEAQNAISQIIKIYDNVEKGINKIDNIL